MLNLLLAVLVSALVVTGKILNYLKGPLALGAVVGFIVINFSAKAEAAVKYVDPIVAKYGQDYTSLEVLEFYGCTWSHLVILVCVIVILVAVLFKIAPRSQWSTRN